MLYLIIFFYLFFGSNLNCAEIKKETAIFPSYSMVLSDFPNDFNKVFGIGAEYDIQWGKYWSNVLILNTLIGGFKLENSGISKYGTELPSPVPNGITSSDPFHYIWEEYGSEGGLKSTNINFHLRVATNRDNDVRFSFDFGPGVSFMSFPKYISKYHYAVFNTTSTVWDGSNVRYYGIWNVNDYDYSASMESKGYFNIGAGMSLTFKINSNMFLGLGLRSYFPIVSGDYDFSFLNIESKLVYKFGGGFSNRETRMYYNEEPKRINTSYYDSYEPSKDVSLKEKTQTVILSDYKTEPSVGNDEDVSVVSEENADVDFSTNLKKADELYNSKKYDEAAEIYNELLKSAEDNQKPYIYNQLGAISLKSKNYKKAKEYYLSAIVIIKQNNITGKEVVNAYSGLAYCFEKEGKKDSAIKNYKKAMELSTSASTKQKLQKAIDRLSGAGNE